MRIQKSKSLDYVENLFCSEDDAFRKIRLQIEKDNKQGIPIRPFEGKLLQLLIHLIQAKNILEIGTLYGYSTLWLARATESYGGHVTTIEKNPNHLKKAKELLLPFARNITFIEGEAFSQLNHLHHKSSLYDFIFIDADKGGYWDYLLWAENHLKPGGLIIGDNTFLFGHVYGEGFQKHPGVKALESIQKFNERLSDANLYHSLLIPTPEGLTVAQKK